MQSAEEFVLLTGITVIRFELQASGINSKHSFNCANPNLPHFRVFLPPREYLCCWMQFDNIFVAGTPGHIFDPSLGPAGVAWPDLAKFRHSGYF